MPCVFIEVSTGERGGGGLGFYYILQIIIYKIIKGEEKLEMKNII
jgi:hypothetical protein